MALHFRKYFQGLAEIFLSFVNTDWFWFCPLEPGRTSLLSLGHDSSLGTVIVFSWNLD